MKDLILGAKLDGRPSSTLNTLESVISLKTLLSICRSQVLLFRGTRESQLNGMKEGALRTHSTGKSATISCSLRRRSRKRKQDEGADFEIWTLGLVIKGLYYGCAQDVPLHWKWRETKQQPGRARSGHKISSCLVSIHLLCGILRTLRVNSLCPPI